MKKILKDDIIKALKSGKKIYLKVDYFGYPKIELDGIKLHLNSVKAALKILNNNEDIDNAFLICLRSYDKKIWYSPEHKSLLTAKA